MFPINLDGSTPITRSKALALADGRLIFHAYPAPTEALCKLVAETSDVLFCVKVFPE